MDEPTFWVQYSSRTSYERRLEYENGSSCTKSRQKRGRGPVAVFSISSRGSLLLQLPLVNGPREPLTRGRFVPPGLLANLGIFFEEIQ